MFESRKRMRSEHELHAGPTGNGPSSGVWNNLAESTASGSLSPKSKVNQQQSQPQPQPQSTSQGESQSHQSQGQNQFSTEQQSVVSPIFKLDSYQKELYNLASVTAMKAFTSIDHSKLYLGKQGYFTENDASMRYEIMKELYTIVLVEIKNMCEVDKSLQAGPADLKPLQTLIRASNVPSETIASLLNEIAMSVDKEFQAIGLSQAVGSVRQNLTKAVLQLLNSAAENKERERLLASSQDSIASVEYAAALKRRQSGMLNGNGVYDNASFFDAKTILQPLAVPQFNLSAPMQFWKKQKLIGQDGNGFQAEAVTKRNMAFLFGDVKLKPYPLIKKRKVGRQIHAGLSEIPNGVCLTHMKIWHKTIPGGFTEKKLTSFDEYIEAINYKHGATFTLYFKTE